MGWEERETIGRLRSGREGREGVGEMVL